jgi:C-terminal processing protease CtpA/Prc
MEALMTRLLSILLLFLLSVPLQARSLTETERLSDFEQLVSMIKSGYGPLHYKENSISMNMETMNTNYRSRVKAAKTNGEFYYTLIEFIAEFKDSHFSAFVPTTHVASVPFMTDLVEGKVLIDSINREKLSEEAFPFSRGDEVLAVNGEAVDSVVSKMARRKGAGYELTARRSATMNLTTRAGKIYDVPTGDVTFTIRHGSSNIIADVKLQWNVSGEALDEVGVPSFKPFANKSSHRDFDMLSIDFVGPRHEKDFRCSGRTRIEIPKDATVIMNTPDAPFVAYYHPTPKGNVGYLRIPHYLPMNEQTGEDEYDIRFAQYAFAVSELEKHTVGLIIDQDHNCGGSVDWLHRMLGLFIGRDFKPIQFKLLANKEEYLEFQKWVAETPKFSIEKQNVEKTMALLKTSWLNGEFMTPATSIDGAEALYSYPVRYTKPIIVLIDEMSGSGGDAFPSMIQGFGRAKLLGTRTMGAGGHVVEQPCC